MPELRNLNTNYKGLEITQEEYQELMEQPVADMLRFVPAGDRYIIQGKLPETGMYDSSIYGERPESEGREYSLSDFGKQVQAQCHEAVIQNNQAQP